MRDRTYKARVRRRWGKWRVSVPALPGSPVLRTDKLGNAAPLLIMSLAEWMGVNPSVLSVEVEQPVRARRPLPSHTLAQLGGAAVVLSGLYLLAGVAVTLIATGLVIAALGVLREAGRI